MVDYTRLFSELAAPLAKMGDDDAAAEQNSGYVNVAKYHRIAIVLYAIQVTTTLDLDVEITTDGVSAGLFTLKSITQLTADDDGAVVVIEIRTDELGKPSGASSENYDYVNIEVTPVGACTYSCMVFGLVPRYAPVDQPGWAEVVT